VRQTWRDDAALDEALGVAERALETYGERMSRTTLKTNEWREWVKALNARQCVEGVIGAFARRKGEKSWTARARERRALDVGRRIAEGLIRASEFDSSIDREVDEMLYALRRAGNSRASDVWVKVNCARVVATAFTPKRRNIIVFDEARLLARHWRTLVECLPDVPVENADIIDLAAPNARAGTGAREWALSLGGCLATLAASDADKESELLMLIDKLLNGSGGARVLGLTILHAAFAVEGLIKDDDLARYLHKALAAMSGAPAEHVDACVTVGMRAAGIAARNLKDVDLITLRTKWLAPRLEATGFSWRNEGQGAKLSISKYLSIPRAERVSPIAMSSFLIADLDLVGYISPDEFRRKVVHGAVDLAEAAFRRLPDDERAMGCVIAATVVVTQMNLVHSLFVEPGILDNTSDPLLAKFMAEGSLILCNKALELMTLERSNESVKVANADIKIDQLTAELQTKVILGVLNYALTAVIVGIDNPMRNTLVVWCGEKLDSPSITATDDTLRLLISSGCALALLRLTETSPMISMREGCLRCYRILIDLSSESSTLHDFVELIALKTPSLDLLGVENKSEYDRRMTYIVAALNWAKAQLHSARTLVQSEEVLRLFRRLFIMLPAKEHPFWLEAMSNMYASAALWSESVESEVLTDAERVLSDAHAQTCVESFDESFDDGSINSSNIPDWVKKMRLRATWLREAFESLSSDSLAASVFTSNIAMIISKSVEFSTKGKADANVDTSYWPGSQPQVYVGARSPLGPGGILVSAASVFDFLAVQLKLRSVALTKDNVETLLAEYTGLSYLVYITMNSLVKAARAIRTPGSVISSRIACTGARALAEMAIGSARFSVLSNAYNHDDFEAAPPLGTIVIRALEAANELEECSLLVTSSRAHRRRFAATRAELARAISVIDQRGAAIEFDSNRIRSRRRHSEHEADAGKRQRIDHGADINEADQEDPGDAGASILQAYEPSTDEESDSEEEEDEDAFVVRGKTFN